ncbi:MAG: VRR-NUC domain-containing protein [Patulibacter sp.]|nr:VRR-NUC domain-containing protein [Patulibacter sp.]
MPRTIKRHAADGTLTEQAWQHQVIGIARLGGWRRIYHAPHGGRSGRAAYGQIPEGTGFPDLLLIRVRTDGTADILVAELKTQRGKLGKQQPEWLKAFMAAGIEAYVWRPDDLDQVTQRLTGNRKAAA